MTTTTERPSDAKAVEAKQLIHAALEDRLLELEGDIRPLIGCDPTTRWQVISSALFALAMEVMALTEPDANIFIAKLRRMPDVDDELLEAFHARVRKDHAPTIQ
jgi:hypothetical protein